MPSVEDSQDVAVVTSLEAEGLGSYSGAVLSFVEESHLVINFTLNFPLHNTG